jgi:hypothetical protein
MSFRRERSEESRSENTSSARFLVGRRGDLLGMTNVRCLSLGHFRKSARILLKSTSSKLL